MKECESIGPDNDTKNNVGGLEREAYEEDKDRQGKSSSSSNSRSEPRYHMKHANLGKMR